MEAPTCFTRTSSCDKRSDSKISQNSLVNLSKIDKLRLSYSYASVRVHAMLSGSRRSRSFLS